MQGKRNEIINYLLTQNEETIFEVKEYKKKRSMTQNSYSWVLQNQLAEKLRISKEELHFMMLKNYAPRQAISIMSSINPNGFFEYYEAFGTGEVNGKEFTHYYVYKESHKMDTKEFTAYLDGIIHECEEQGIPTLTQKQIQEMRMI